MPETPISFPGELPASLRCGFCGQLIDGIFFRTFKRFTCDRCAAEARLAEKRNQFEPISFARGAIAGVVVAAAGAVAWALVEYITHFQIGIVAAFIGVFVGKAVYAASGKRRGRALQILCVVLSILGVGTGRIVLAGFGVMNWMKSQDIHMSPIQFLRTFTRYVIDSPQEVFTYFDLVWVGIAAYSAWKICKPVQIVVAGPYRYQPPANQHDATASALQFDTVEPEQSAGSSGPT